MLVYVCSNYKYRYVAAATLSLTSTGTAADETSAVVAAETAAAAHVQAEAHFAASEAAEKNMIDEMRTQAQAQLDAEILDDDEIGEEGVSEALHSASVDSSELQVARDLKAEKSAPASFSDDESSNDSASSPRAAATAEATTFWSGKNQLYPRNSEGSGPPPGPPSGPPAAGPPLSGPPPEPQQQTESVDEEEPLENTAKLEGLTELVRRSKAAVSTLPPGPSPPSQGPAPTPRGGPRPPSTLRTAPPQAVQAEPSKVETAGGKGNGTEEAEEGTTTPTMKSIVKKVIPPGPTLFDHFLAMATLYQPPPPPSEPVSVVTSVFIGQKSSACLYVV